MAQLQKKNCIFCKIIAGEIPSKKIYEDDDVLVILDINPANEGHCLILPKQHFQILPQIPDDLIGKVFNAAKKTSRVLLKGLGVRGTTIFVANGAMAGQKAPHFMAHVVPRKPGDMLFNIPKNAIEKDKLQVLSSQLSAKMAALTGRQLPEKKSPEAPDTTHYRGDTPPFEHDVEKAASQEVKKQGIKQQISDVPAETQEAMMQTDPATLDEPPSQENEAEKEPEDKKKDLSIDDITRMFS